MYKAYKAARHLIALVTLSYKDGKSYVSLTSQILVPLPFRPEHGNASMAAKISMVVVFPRTNYLTRSTSTTNKKQVSNTGALSTIITSLCRTIRLSSQPFLYSK